jgi:hypothetical protein
MRISGQKIDGSGISCTGNQLLAILRILQGGNEPYIWFGADVHCDTPEKWQPWSSNALPKAIGTIEDLANLASSVSQFESGIFLAVPENLTAPSWNRRFFTDESQFPVLGPAVIEVRAFDCSYFEIYVRDASLLSALAQRFECPIEPQ